MIGKLSDLDLRLVRVFVAVAEAQGLAAAQSALNTSSSTISLQLSALEGRLGYRLCERGRGGFALTPQGGAFLEAAHALLRQVEGFEQVARGLSGELVGTLRIGLIGHTAMSANARLAQAIRRFRQRRENVELHLSVLPPGTLEEALIQEKVHVGVGYFWHPVPSLIYQPLFTEHQVAYAGRDHPLFAQAGQLSLAAVAGHDWVWRSYPLPKLPFSIEGWRIRARADNMEAVAVLLQSGHHLGFLPDHFAAPMVAGGALAALNPQALAYDAPFQMVLRPHYQRQPSLMALVEDLRAAHGVG